MEEKERVEDTGIKVQDNTLIGKIAGGRGRILSARSTSAGDRIMRRKREREDTCRVLRATEQECMITTAEAI